MDRKSNPIVGRMRLQVQFHEQQLILQRQELLLLELADEGEKIKESLGLTKERIASLEQSIQEEGK